MHEIVQILALFFLQWGKNQREESSWIGYGYGNRIDRSSIDCQTTFLSAHLCSAMFMYAGREKLVQFLDSHDPADWISSIDLDASSTTDGLIKIWKRYGLIIIKKISISSIYFHFHLRGYEPKKG